MLQGHYRIERVLGAGAFGRVYLATDTLDSHDSPIAIKELLDTHFTTPDDKREAIAWFKREVSTLLALDHPGIPAIHAYWTAQRMAGPFYLAMDYIPGPTLDELLHSAGTVAWRQVVEWGIALCDVLGYLHSQTPPFVFRDVKLPNVIIDDRKNQPVLIDFGITRQLATSSGTAIGTWGYVPYEQVLGKAEPRSDLYALGATLHALLTGRYPDTEYTRLQRSGLDVEATMRALFPPADMLVSGVPSTVAEALAHATAFALADRFPDAAAMAAALRQALDDGSLSATTPVSHVASPPPQPSAPTAVSGVHAGAPHAHTPPIAAPARAVPVRSRQSSSLLYRFVFWTLIVFGGIVALEAVGALVSLTDHGAAPYVGSSNAAPHARRVARMPVEFTALAFTSDTTGYAVGADRAYKTTDGGLHWTPLTARSTSGLSSGQTLSTALAFPSVSVGYAATDALLKTSDGGTHWREVSFPNLNLNSNALDFLTFPTVTIGYASYANANTLFKTTDGGKNWQEITPGGVFCCLMALAFPGVSIGYAAVDVNDDVLAKTTDGGQEWNRLSSFPNHHHSPILALAFPSVQTGYAALEDSRLLKTTDGGQHWQQLPNGPWGGDPTKDSSVLLVSLAFPSATTGYAITSPNTSNGLLLFKTTDGGKYWKELSSTTASSS